MKRQALRDAVIRSNAEGLAGLKDRPKGHPPQKLSEAYEAAFAAAIFRGPDPQTDGVSAWTRPDLVPLARRAFCQDVPSLEPEAGAAAHGAVGQKV